MRLKYRNQLIKIVIGIIGLIGAGTLLLLTNKYGAGVTPDSVAYISAARNLADRYNFLTFNGMPLIVQPPLYSIILAVLKKILLIDPQISTGYVNAALFGFIIYISGLLFLRYMKSIILVILGTVSILISYPLVQASIMALTEPLFIFLVLLFLYYFEEYQSKQNYISFIIFSVSAALACLTRYTGVAIVFTGIFGILLRGRNNIKNKYWISLIFIIIAVLPTGLWIGRNYFLSGTLVGFRGASSYTLLENMKLFSETIFSWYFISVQIGVCFLLLLISLALIGIYKGKTSKSEILNLFTSNQVFLLFYSGIIIISSTTTAYDPICDRLLSPIYIPLIIFIFFIADRILSWLKSIYNPNITAFIFFITIVILSKYPLKNTTHFIEDYIAQSGWGFSSSYWKENDIISYLNHNEEIGKKYTLFSNEPEAVYFLTNINARRSPVKTFYNSSQPYNSQPDEIDLWIKAENICLVWFNNANRSFLYTIDELKKDKNMEEVAQLKEGGIYIISKK
jgi:hypothetical protein